MRTLVAAVVLVTSLGALPGCELVADFDRAKIPGPDASFDAGMPRFGDDEDGGASDGGADRSTGGDAGTDDDAG